MTTSTIKLNNVDLAAVGELTEAIRTEPARASTTWHATVAWQEGFRTATNVRDFPAVASDEPAGLGGSDTAPNPVEHLLGALGSCLAIGYAANATAAGIAIEDLRIELEGDLDLRSFLGLEPGHAGYTDLRATVHITADADDAALVALHEQVIATSPVGHTLASAVPLSIGLAP